MLGIIETSIGYICNTLLYRCPRENCSIVHQPRTFTDPSQTPTTHVHRSLTNNNHTCSTIPHEHQPHTFTNPSRTPTTHFHRFLTNTNHTQSPIPHDHQPHIFTDSSRTPTTHVHRSLTNTNHTSVRSHVIIMENRK